MFSNEQQQRQSESDDEFDSSNGICDKIYLHVIKCITCQKRLSFDPIEKSLLKTRSVKNEIMELIAYISTGIFIIFVLQYLGGGVSNN